MMPMAKGCSLSPISAPDVPRARVEPIARLFGRVGPDAQCADGHRPGHRRDRGRCRGRSGVGRRRTCWWRSAPPSTCSMAPSPARPAPDVEVRRVPRQHPRSRRRGRRLHRHRGRGLLRPFAGRARYGALLAMTAMAAAFMVSYTRAKSESLGFTPVRHGPTSDWRRAEVRIAILTVGLVLTGLAGGLPDAETRWWQSDSARLAAAQPGGSSRSWPPSPPSSGSSFVLSTIKAVRRTIVNHGKERPQQRQRPHAPRQGRQDPRRHRRRRQLRQQPGAGPLLLRGRQAGRLRPRPDARQPRRLPHQRHRVRGRIRHRQEQGRQGPLRGHLREAQQHLRLPAGAATWA